MSDLSYKITEISEIPSIDRAGGASKYNDLFEAAANAKTGKIEVAFDDDTSGGRAGYLNRVSPEGYIVQKRGDSIIIVSPKAPEAKGLIATAAKRAAKRAETEAKKQKTA